MLNSKRNLILNKVNWNISVTLGIKIKRDYLLFLLKINNSLKII